MDLKEAYDKRMNQIAGIERTDEKVEFSEEKKN